MAGKFTALLLAILVANPFCCCFAAENEVAASEHACCQATAPESAPSDSEPCDCTEDPSDPSALSSPVKVGVPEWTLVAEIAWEFIPEVEAPSSGYLRGAGDLPDAVKPPGKVISQMHCRYLL